MNTSTPTSSTANTRRLESKGVVVHTTLTDLAAMEILRTITGNAFAKTLLAKYAAYGSWTTGQLVWAHKIAMEAQNPQSSQQSAQHREEIGNFEAIASLFKTSLANGLKHPKIKFDFEDDPIHLILAGARSKYTGSINVTNGGGFRDGTWFGRINQDGTFTRSKACPEQVVDFLKLFAQDPAGLAASYGKDSGCCCFCARALEDERSTSVGYGPVCAKKYGLAWGGSLAKLSSN